MPVTAHETILTAVAARLANIKLVNGYTTSPKKIVCARIEPFQSIDELPVINYWSVTDTISKDKYGGEQHEFDFVVEIFSVSDPSEAALSIAASRLAGDVITALARAPSAPLVADTISRALGGLVSHSQLRFFDYRVGEGASPWLAVALRFTAEYQAGLSDPYSIQE